MVVQIVVWWQAIIWTNASILLNGTLETNLMKFEAKYNFQSRMWRRGIWKYSPGNGHFVFQHILCPCHHLKVQSTIPSRPCTHGWHCNDRWMKSHHYQSTRLSTEKTSDRSGRCWCRLLEGHQSLCWQLDDKWGNMKVTLSHTGPWGTSENIYKGFLKQRTLDTWGLNKMCNIFKNVQRYLWQKMCIISMKFEVWTEVH